VVLDRAAVRGAPDS